MDKTELTSKLEQQVDYLIEVQKKCKLVNEVIAASKQIVEVIMVINSIKGTSKY